MHHRASHGDDIRLAPGGSWPQKAPRSCPWDWRIPVFCRDQFYHPARCLKTENRHCRNSFALGHLTTDKPQRAFVFIDINNALDSLEVVLLERHY
ncbi:MAG TPA: hypothetical protein DCE55_28730 [Planctomycetaceae bacterium]|nr:hypothetical protein [Planctomycetaceae bacterium]